MQSPKKLVFINLTGAPDGLELLPAYGDPSFQELRGNLYRGAPGVGGIAPLALNNTFAVSGKLPFFKTLYNSGQYLPIHAAGFAHTSRSHFDAQKTLQNGTLSTNNKNGGWLNRAMQVIIEKAKLDASVAPLLTFVPYASAPLLARGTAVPLIVEPGSTPYLQQEYYNTLFSSLYGGSAPDLQAPYSKQTALHHALQLRQLLADYVSKVDNSGGLDTAIRRMSSETEKAAVIGKLFSLPDGPRLATLQIGSWDSHANQNLEGSYGELLSALNNTVKALQSNMGNEWKNCVVIAGGEFGRTCRVNGTEGTDHGIGTAWHLLGGAVNGGRVLADWPGLEAANMVEGRYLKPTTNMLGIFKGVLKDGFGLNSTDLDTIFPGSSAVAPVAGLLRV